jgi:hypothetical protein
MRSTEPDEPLDLDDLPPELQDALRRMSARGDGPVIDLGTGALVAKDGALVTDPPDGQEPVACSECARAVALGWWGSIARHMGAPGTPVCWLCGEGKAILTPAQWFAEVVALIQANGPQRRTWHEDAIKGMGAFTMPEPPGQA